ncbi:MAG: D-alanyl-D-alanine carboxypeptidase [Cyclobacteriaceae bacterium]
MGIKVWKALPLFFVIAIGCAPGNRIRKSLIQSEKEFNEHIGFLLYDPGSHKSLADFNSDKYFTPASNTKIFTFYTSLQVLGDSIPGLRYVVQNDSLIFWGTGDPSFLYEEVSKSDRVFQFLKTHPSNLYYSKSGFDATALGPGWAWDDYPYGYSAERSALPLYGNTVIFTDTITGNVKASPSYFQSHLVRGSRKEKPELERGFDDNQFTFSPGIDSMKFTRVFPFKTSAEMTVALLSDTLKRKVALVDIPPPTSVNVVYSLPSDSLYKVMMQESDNFIAEQLLLMCAGVISDTLKSEIAIEHAKENFLFDLPDEPQWVDGSGLSRYNLFTPRSVVRLWQKIYEKMPRERLFPLLATGGVTGTIKNAYKGDTPYIYGKTGTLSNNHCLSGYILTKKNRLLIFSYMNNNYTVPTRKIRSQMEAVLKEVHEKY